LEDLSQKLAAKPDVISALQDFWDEAQSETPKPEDDPPTPKRAKPRKPARGLSR